MKTTTSLLLTAIFLGTFSFLKAQQLNIKANVKDENGHKLKTYYSLKSLSGKLNSGESSEMDLQVYLTGDYSITFNKEGYESKTVYFSTVINPNQPEYFNLEVTLHKAGSGPALGFDNRKHVASVYYDGVTHAYTRAAEKEAEGEQQE